MDRGSRDYGSILLGSASEGGFKQRVRIQTLLTSFLLIANLIGAILAIALSAVGIPEPSLFQAELWWVNYIAVPVYVAVAFVVALMCRVCEGRRRPKELV